MQLNAVTEQRWFRALYHVNNDVTPRFATMRDLAISIRLNIIAESR